jgi:hypothetical protein
VETLVREPEQEQAAADATANGGVPPHAGSANGNAPVAAEAPARTCEVCGAAMTEEQDWCLQCGTARPGRLGTRPGWRVALSISGVTLLLVCGAVAASYAALTDDAGKQADSPGGGNATPVAQAPAQVPSISTPGALPPASADTTAGTPPITTSPPPTGSTTSALPPLPTVTSGTLPTTTTGVTTTTGTTTTGTTTTGTTTTGTTTTGTTTTGTTTGTTTTGTTTTPSALTPITLGADTADIYDPYQRATDKGDPANAYDPNAKDAWFVQTAADGKPMQVGLLVDLEARKTVKQIEFSTTTPGFRLEVYSTDGSQLPPDILDTRWTHLASRSDVDQNTAGSNVKADGKEIVTLRKSGGQVRHLALWFTTPPDQGATVRLRDLVIKG